MKHSYRNYQTTHQQILEEHHFKKLLI